MPPQRHRTTPNGPPTRRPVRHLIALAPILFATSTTEARQWTDATGKYTVEAEFVELSAGVVKLSASDGKTISLPLEKLSAADQRHVKKLVAAAAGNKPASPANGGGWGVVEAALASVRDVKAQMFSRESSVLGPLPSPAELAATQMELRPIPRPQPGGPGTVTFTTAQKRQFANDYKDKPIASFGKTGRCFPKTIPLGITGAQVVEFLKRKELFVAGVQPETPADGKLQRGDVIVGANGRLFEDAEDPRPEMGHALAESQSPELKGRLTLQIVRDGHPMNIGIELGDAEPYAETWPFACAKSDRLKADALELVMGSDLRKEDGWTWTPLFLMASGDDAALERARRVIYSNSKERYPEELGGANNWVAAYRLINIAEYYLLTGDSAVLPEIEYTAKVLEKQQYPHGGWTHGEPGGYGQINACGLAAFIGLILARECGVDTDPEELATAIRYFGKWCGTNLPYGEGSPGGRSGRMDNGMNSMSAIAFHLLGEKGMAERWARTVCYMWMGREKGHAEGIFSLAWGPLGAALAPEEEFHMFMNRTQWLYEMGRTSDKGYVYMRGSRKAYPQGMTPAVGMFFYLPERRLRILGAGRGAFGTRPPAPLAKAAELYREKRWADLKRALEAYLRRPAAPHAEYAKGLLAAYRELERHAGATLKLAEANIKEGRKATAAAQLDALRRLLGEERPAAARLRRSLGSGALSDPATPKTEHAALHPKWAEGLGIDRRSGIRDGFANSYEYIVRTNQGAHKDKAPEEIARYLAHFSSGPADAAIEALAARGDEVSPLLQKLMGDTHPWLRAGAVETLATVYRVDPKAPGGGKPDAGLQKVAGQIGRLADDPHPGVQAALVKFIESTRLETPQTRKIMIRMAASDDPGVRVSAANMARSWLKDPETVIQIGMHVSAAPDGNTPRHWQYAHMGVARFKSDPRCRKAIPAMAAFLAGPSNKAPIRGFFSDSAQHVPLQVMLAQWDQEVEAMPDVVTGICRSYVRTPSPSIKNYKGWHNLRLDSQKLFDKFTPAAIPALRAFVAEEKRWLAEIDDGLLDLTTQLKGQEARKTTLERIEHIAALADRLER